MPIIHKVNKVLIINQVALNLGDAAILWGNIEILKKKYGPDIEIVVFDAAADIAQKYRPWVKFRHSLFFRPARSVVGRLLQRSRYAHWNNRLSFFRLSLAMKLLNIHASFLAKLFVTEDELIDLQHYFSADLVVSAGGTYLIENYNLTARIMEFRFVLAIGKPLILFTQTLGPFNNPLNRRAFQKIFSAAEVILLRDERSKSHILELGVEPKNIHLAADAAFTLAQDMIDLQACSDNIERPASVSKVAISVRSMTNFHPTKREQYFNAIVLAVTIVVEEFGAKVTFLSTCQGIDEYWANDDETADEIYALLPENIRHSVDVDRKFRQPLELVKKYQSFDAVIATRMHAAILSFCAGVPTLGFSYEYKIEEMFKAVEMEELVINIDSFSLDDVVNSVQRLLSDSDLYRTKVVLAAEKMCMQAWSAEHALPNII